MVGGRGAWDSSSASTRDPSCDLCKTVAAVAVFCVGSWQLRMYLRLSLISFTRGLRGVARTCLSSLKLKTSQCPDTLCLARERLLIE